MNNAIRALLSLAFAVFASACGPGADTSNKPAAAMAEAEMDADAPKGLITGSVSYRERMALGPNAEINIRLEDVSLADAPSTLIAEKNMTVKSQVPIRFELAYDPALIQDRNSYAVRATISENGRMLFTTDTHYSVLTRGGSNTVDIVLVRTNVSTAARVTLTNTHWLLSSIGGQDVSVPKSGEAPYLRLTTEENLAQGFSGCNRYSGAWELRDNSISLGPLAMTMMACIGEEILF